MTPDLRETWTVRKPAVRSAGGVVSTQHHVASEVGARVLAGGGNAVDAAVTAGLALGTVEPWMSGLGGCGQMVVHLAGEGRAWSVDFGLVASRHLDPADYPPDEGRGSDLFNWPAVVGGPERHGAPVDRGPHLGGGSGGGPRTVRNPVLGGLHRPRRRVSRSEGWSRTGTRPSRSPPPRRASRPTTSAAGSIFRAASRPARSGAGRRPGSASGGSRRPCAGSGKPAPGTSTRARVARSLVADAERLGAKLAPDDLAGVEVRIREALAIPYGDATVHAAPGLTGGPSLARALALVTERRAAVREEGRRETEADLAVAYADALSTAYAERLAALGHDAEASAPACTTHLSVVDREGNVVALTQTLLSLFGSRVMFPATGVLMNNGVMWFDPRPGRPNSIAPGRRPLANMCPVVVERGGGDRFALGASGGRRIMPAVMQLVSFLVDSGLDLEDAFHAPRIDASGGEYVTVDPRFAPSVAAALRERYPVEAWPNAVYPAMYACPNGAGALEGGGRVGAAYVMSPWALAAPAELE